MLSVFWEASTQPKKFLLFIIKNDFEFNQKYKLINVTLGLFISSLIVTKLFKNAWFRMPTIYFPNIGRYLIN